MSELKPVDYSGKKKMFSGSELDNRTIKVLHHSKVQERFLYILLFGAWGVGKTWALKGLLEKGFRIFVLGTDMGDNEVGGSKGLITIENALRSEGKEHLLDNLMSVGLSGYMETYNFLLDPTKFIPDFYQLNFDWLVWEGFSWFQQIDLSDYVAMSPISKESSVARSTGLYFGKPDWGMIRNGTVRPMERFLSLYNKETGKQWHKIVTCQENLKSNEEKAGGGFTNTQMPLLQGSGGILSGVGFDLIINAEADNGVYTYSIRPGKNRMAKNRGFNLEPIMPGDMGALWSRVASQLGQPISPLTNASEVG